MSYVAYDLKGVQSQIFGLPKLVAICGTSSLLAEFDKQAERRGVDCGAELIFAGGGRGVYWCADGDNRRRLIECLVNDAHERGFDVRVGVDESLSHACHHADQLFVYNPDELTGPPCRLSGRWPVGASPSRGAYRGVHPIIADRLRAGREDLLGATILQDLRDRADLPAELSAFELRFFRNIAAPSVQGEPVEDDQDLLQWERDDAGAAANAIGRKSRWGVACLDGNDIGVQFLAFHQWKEANQATDEEERDWVRAMSHALGEITRAAFLDALVEVLKLWVADGGPELLDACSYIDRMEKNDKPTLVLPLRPLILGGDDVTLLIHPAYAMTFVKTMTRRFDERSREMEEERRREQEKSQRKLVPLWPATLGRLTMSAGVLYCKTTFPLHMAIDYAEDLLKGAKARFRSRTSVIGNPTAAAVDWESITETLVESPEARRRRELEFIDEELGGRKVVLYGRPYAMEPHPTATHIGEIDKLASQLSAIPTSVLAQVLPRLKRPWSERVAFLASVAKRHGILKQLLWENASSLGEGWKVRSEDQTRVAIVPDALLLLEEERRLQQQASIA